MSEEDMTAAGMKPRLSCIYMSIYSNLMISYDKTLEYSFNLNPFFRSHVQ